MITCEASGRAWTVEGKIEGQPGTDYVDVDDLSALLVQHVGKWVKVRVELIEGPSQRPSEVVDVDLKRMRELTQRVRLILKLLRTLPVETSEGARRWGYAPEEGLLESTAETMLVVCDRIEEFFRRLRAVEETSEVKALANDRGEPR